MEHKDIIKIILATMQPIENDFQDFFCDVLEENSSEVRNIIRSSSELSLKVSTIFSLLDEVKSQLTAILIENLLK